MLVGFSRDEKATEGIDLKVFKCVYGYGCSLGGDEVIESCGGLMQSFVLQF